MVAFSRAMICVLAFLLTGLAPSEAPADSGPDFARPAAAVVTRAYLPLQAGDRRLYLYANGDVADERTAGPVTVDGHQTWKFSSTGHGSGRVIYLEDINGATYMHGFDADDMTVRFSPHPKLLAPNAYEGAKWHSEGKCIVGGIWTVAYYLDVTVEQVHASCSTQAGTFEDCLVLRILGQIGTGPDADYIEEVWWLARDVGVVKVTDDANPNESRELIYARVGGREYGTRPPAVGDFNGDGRVDVEDARLLLEAYLKAQYSVEFDIYPYDATPPEIIPRPDGLIDERDLATFIQLWRAYHPQAAP